VTPRAALRHDRLRRWVWAFIDAVIWIIAIYGATWLRYDFDRRPVFVNGAGLFAIVAAGATILVGALIGPYGVGHTRGSFEEAIDVGRNAVLVAGASSATGTPTATYSATAGTTSTPGTGTATATSTPAPTAPIPSSLLGHVVSRIPTSRRIVALAFDAGANGDGVDSILSTLAR
jgi:hypothetical protein